MSQSDPLGNASTNVPPIHDLLLDAVVASAPVVLFATDAQGVITLSRGKALEALGLREGELVGQSVFDLYVTEPAVADAARRALQGDDVIARLDLDGVIHETRFAPRWADGEVAGLVGVASDITAQEEAARLLRYQATHSAVTGLPNRPIFVHQVDGAVATAREHTVPVTLLVVLIDHFHEVSETFGYAVGSTIRRDSADRIRELAMEDEITGELEAGKFGVFVPHSLRTAQSQAQQIRDALAAPFVVEGRELRLSIHVGIATFPGHGDDAELLLRAAEQAARSAATWRREVAVYEARTDDLRRNFTLLADLRSALAAQALRVEYQPVVAIRSLALESVEALVRWDHPQFGAISPGEFIGLADRAGMLPRVTEFVLESAVRDLYLWEQEGLRLRAGVNLSPTELLSPEIADFVGMGVDAWGLGLDRLTLEVTEDQQLGQLTISQLGTLRNLVDGGMHIAIDDFGTGYSNLSSLHLLPWTHLKVDRSLVVGVDGGSRDAELLKATVSLAHAFGRPVLAEGVETPQQWEHVKSLGFDSVQGYHVSRPLRPELLPSFLQDSGWGPPP